MKKIEVRTTQNVSIEYKAATVFERIAAWLLDAIVIAVSIGILLLIASMFFQNRPHLMEYFIITPVAGFYSIAFEVFNQGQTLGKMALSIRVVKLEGDKITLYDYFIRWMFRLIDISAFGIVAIITIAASPRNQRIGDYLADTTVIKVQKTGRLTLDKILSLEGLKKYKPQYPEISKLSEQDMLLVKEVVSRNQLSPTEGSKKALQLLIEKIESQLDIKAPPNKKEFLLTLIKDYVVLTR